MKHRRLFLKTPSAQFTVEKHLVVAGDNKQLPPTSFFQKNLIDDVDWDELSDEDVEVFDSILRRVLRHWVAS